MTTDDEVGAAMRALLGREPTSRRSLDELLEAGREAVRRRTRNTIEGGLVFAELQRQGLSWEAIADGCGIPRSTAQRWARPMEDET